MAVMSSIVRMGNAQTNDRRSYWNCRHAIGLSMLVVLASCAVEGRNEVSVRIHSAFKRHLKNSVDRTFVDERTSR